MKTKLTLATLFFVCATMLSLGQERVTNLENYLTHEAESGSLEVKDASYVITSQHTSSTSGIHHVYFNQAINGLKIIGTESSVHLSKTDVVIKKSIRFLPDTQSKVNASSPSLSALNAITSAANQLGYTIKSNISEITSTNERSNTKQFTTGGISLSPIPVELVYFANEKGDIILGWDLSIQETTGQNWWNVIVDASSGAIINQVNWVTSCNFDHDHSTHEKVETLDYNSNLYDIPNYTAVADDLAGCVECYEVFAFPIESPYFGNRTIEVNPASSIASPFGWHDTNGVPGAEFTITRGNNVHAFDAGDNQGFSPDAGDDLDFIGYPFSQTYTNQNQFEEAAITNLFYWNNIIHDVFNVYGFDAVSGNFQENNYGQGGLGSDSVDAQAQIAVLCNAFMATPPDGANPRMEMYVCGDKDGNFDNLVIAHEYGHGITNRLTGGAAAAGCLQSNEQMGEGWSDYFGIIMTMTADDIGPDPRPVGTYLFGQGPNGNGIRPFPLSTDLTVNPHTYNDIGSESIPHGVGSVWSAMLWDMTWLLIDEYGWDADLDNFTGDINQDAGNVMSLALVVEALKFQPCAPGFVDGRDAILAADVALYDGANQCLIWEAFARRGLGVSADQGSSASTGDGTEAFDVPSGLAEFTAPADLCQSVDVTILQGGSPFGGVYSGPGVTDNGDGSSYTFDPVAAGVGVHTITYEVQDGVCSIASIASDEVEVLFAPQPPTSIGATDVCGNEEVTVTATVTDPSNTIKWYDAPTGGTLLSQGASYTFSPTEDTTLYAEEGPVFTTSELKISEISLQFPDVIEVTNIGATFDYTGYKLVISEEPFDQFNVVNPITQDIGMMQENSAKFYSDDANAGANAWGNNIWWGEGGSGWALIIDPSGNVVDSVFWNASEALVNSFNIATEGFNITAADLEWQGAGADFSDVCNSSFRRTGENDNASNWLATCLDSDYGIYNADIGLGFQDCLASRVPTLVTVETQIPTISCPEDETVIIETGTTIAVPNFTESAVATDNCDEVTVTQSPNPGQNVDEGQYEITLTATDGAGNEVSCSFTYTVNEVLDVNEAALGSHISISPNPTSGMVQLVNNTSVVLKQVTVVDVNGRIVQTIKPTPIGITDIDLTQVAQGVYFVKIISENASVIKRIIKR